MEYPLVKTRQIPWIEGEQQIYPRNADWWNTNAGLTGMGRDEEMPKELEMVEK